MMPVDDEYTERLRLLAEALPEGAAPMIHAREIDPPRYDPFSHRVLCLDPEGRWLLEVHPHGIEVGPAMTEWESADEPIPVTRPVSFLAWRSLPDDPVALHEALTPHLARAREAWLQRRVECVECLRTVDRDSAVPLTLVWICHDCVREALDPEAPGSHPG